jgi:hypothetical protein
VLDGSLEQAQSAFYAMDLQAFRKASDEAALLAGCLKDRVSPALAAKVHRVRGLREYVEGHDAEAKAAFAAARRVEPGYAFPTSVAAADHPVRETYATAPPVQLAQPAPASDGRLEFDGVPGGRPVGVPTLAQVVARNGTVLQGSYLSPDDALSGGVGAIAGSKKGKGNKPAALASASSGYVAPAGAAVPVPVAEATGSGGADAAPTTEATPAEGGDAAPAGAGAPAEGTPGGGPIAEGTGTEPGAADVAVADGSDGGMDADPGAIEGGYTPDGAYGGDPSQFGYPGGAFPTERVAGRKRPNMPLVVTAAASAAVALGCYGVANIERGVFDDPATSDADVKALQGTINGLVVASAGLGVVAIGAGVGAFVVGSF